MADDFGGNIATLGTFNVGVRRTGTIEAAADQDWFKGWLFAGHTYVIQSRGTPTTDGTLTDPTIRVHDEAGTQIAFDDDSGIGNNSYLRFVPEATGFYFLDARAFNILTGTYEIEVSRQSDSLLHYNQWGTGLAATALLGDVNVAATDVDPVTGVIAIVREDLVSIAANGNVFVSLSNPNGSGFADPVLATTGATASDRLFNINNAVDQGSDLFQVFGGNAFVATGNAGDGLNDFTNWGSGFLPSAVVRTFGFNGDFRSDAFQISGGNAQVSLQNATNNGFLGFTNWATGLIGNEQLLDFNGDFLGDLLQIFDGRAYVATSNGVNAFNAFTVAETGLTASDRVGDFNGDGRDDLFQVYTGNMYVSLSNGTTFTGFTQWGSGVTSSNIRIGDINGDLRDDIVQIDGTGHATAAVANSLATGFTGFNPWASSVGANDFIGLVNGDTLADVVQVYNGNAYVWESNLVPAF